MDTGGGDTARAGDFTSEGTRALPAPTAELRVVPTAVPVDPVLPESEPRAPGRMIGHGRPGAGSSAWYRSDQQRSRSVYRRANPWYRRVARGLIGLSVLTALGVGLYVGGRAVQDYMDRDQLPPVGRPAADFSSTSFLVNSAPPALQIDGTITVDTASGAFEFVGGAGGQAGVEIVSPDGTLVYVRTAGGEWRAAGAGDTAVDAILLARPYLLGVDDADDVLERELRRGYVDLIDETTEGEGASALERYEMEFDTRAYSADHPLQWQAYEQAVLPGLGQAEAVPVTMWLDAANVVVRLSDEQSGWSWQRLAYSDRPFTAVLTR